MLKRIFVPLDGSDCANYAYQYALRLAKAEGAALYLCSVTEPAAPHVTDAENVLEAAMRKATLAGVPAGKTVRNGEPRSGIVECAAEMRADVIVMGTHGRSSFKGIVGSVAEYVLRFAPCPVVTVREPSSAARDGAVALVADESAPVCAMRLIEVSPAVFEMLYGEIASFMSGPGAELRGVVDTELLGSEDRRRIAVVAHFASRHDWVRAQWDARLGELLEEIATNSETLEFDLFRSDRFAGAAKTAASS